MKIMTLTMRIPKGKPLLMRGDGSGPTVAGTIVACVLTLLSYITPAPAAATQPTSTTAFTAEAMWKLRRLSDPAISPDGRFAVVCVTTYDVEKSVGRSDLWLIPTKAGKPRQLTSDAANDSSPSWSPDGERIAFISKRGEDKQPQIYTIAFDGGEARRVTNVPTGASAPKWFPDSRRIAFLSEVWADLKTWDEQAQRLSARDESKMSGKLFTQAPLTYWDHFLDDRETHVYVTSVEGGDAKPITFGNGHPLSSADADATSFDIAADGNEIAFASDSDTSGVDPNFDIYIQPVDGGTPRNITGDNAADDTSPLYSPDGKLLAFRRQTIKDFYADRARLMVYERRSASLRSLTDSWDRSADGLVWAPDSRSLFGTIDDAGTNRVYRFDVSGDAPRAITGAQSFGSLAIAGSGPVIVALRQSFTEPPTLVSIIARTGAATKLSDFNDAELAHLARGKVESVTYKGANGDDIQMWITYPPGFTPGRKWPLYLLIHGGPHNSMNDAWQWRWNSQVFANWGYVVAWHNFHGSNGFGQAFTDSITKDWADLPYQDTLKAADWFAAQPWIDAERLTAGGGSYGGYLSTILLGRPNPFKALVAHAAVYNLFTQYATDDGAIHKRHGEFWEDLERYNRNSPHLAAASFRTPTLVVHGQLDMRVPVNHGIELFNTLQNRGVPSEFLYFPDENHWVLKPQNSLFWYDTTRRWLEKYAKPGAVPAIESGLAPETATQAVPAN